MKFILISLLVLFSSSLYSQYMSNQIVNKYVETIDSINSIASNKLILPNYDKHVDPVIEIIQNTSLKELKHIAALMFQATDMHYIYLQNHGYNQYLSIADSNINGKSGLNLSGTALKIQDQINYKISPIVFGLTRIAYWLKIRVKKVTYTIREESTLKLPTAIIDAVVYEIFKGNGRFKLFDNVQFYFYKFWQVPDSFEVGKEYLVPLEPRGNYPLNNKSIIALVTYLDKSKGYYPINNNYIFDKYNFFGFGEKIALSGILNQN